MDGSGKPLLNAGNVMATVSKQRSIILNHSSYYFMHVNFLLLIFGALTAAIILLLTVNCHSAPSNTTIIGENSLVFKRYYVDIIV